MSDNMLSLNGWEQVSCAERDALYDPLTMVPVSSLTDPGAQYGTGVVYTEWGARENGRPVLRDYRYTVGGCKHYFRPAVEAVKSP